MEPHDSTISLVAARRAPRPRRARLVVVSPPELATSVELGGGATMIIGRQPEGEGALALAHGTVSRQHLEIRPDPDAGAHHVRDLGSRNGSWLDGEPLRAPAPLADGAVLRAGDVLLVYERGPALDAGEAPEASRERLPGESAIMRQLRAAVARAARDGSPALVVGETGTGKEWVCRELHEQSGRRGPLLAVNCAALGAQLIESQLFGHVRGAFTGAAKDHPGLFREAEGGTLFLDEVGELPLELQPKLLRAIQEREVHPLGAARPVTVDVRLVAATNRDLAAHVEAGGFRRDLYARLSLWELRVPPLRARRVDLLDWLARFVRRRQAERGLPPAPLALDADAAERVLCAPWPENLRGLDRLAHELVALGRAGVGRHDLPAWLGETRAPVPAPAAPAAARVAPPTREEFEAAMRELGGSVRALARRFARDRRQIYRWIEAWGLEHLRPRPGRDGG